MRRLVPMFGLLLATAAMACGGDGGSDTSCVLNSDCVLTESCVRGRCIPECREDRDCPDGLRCEQEACVDPAADGGGDTDPDTAVLDTSADAHDGIDDPSTDDPTDTVPDVPRPDGTGTITGRVHFRLYDDSILPVAEPIVYWTLPEDAPAPLDTGASCACGYPETATIGAADGTFVLEGVPAGPVLLVVQKGEFRRVRPIDVEPDASVAAPPSVTELPVRDDPDSGDEIPDIVIGTGRFDPIEDVFAKLRMGPITSTFGFDYREYLADPDAWGVTLMAYQPPAEVDDDESYADIVWSTAVDDYLALLGDAEALRAWDFVFSPCARTNEYRAGLTSATVRDNLRAYVNEGGKLYATDYSYDVIEQPFPEYIDFTNPSHEDTNADGDIGNPDRMSIATYDSRRYASPTKALSPLLRQWLFALDADSEGLVNTDGNWVNIDDVGAGEQCCREGELVEVVPEVVMSGPNYEIRNMFEEGVLYDSWAEAEAADANHPHTLRFPYGCGEVMYSTYHTTEYTDRNATLSEQELVLLWLILEVNECNLDPIKE